MQTVKQAAKEVIEQLPDEVSWDDVHYELYVKQKIEAGLAAAQAGHTVPHEEAKQRLLNGRR